MSGERGWDVVRIGEVAPIAVAGAEVNWLPLRRTLGLESFGMNAYRGNTGEIVVETHTEATHGHQEAYVVLTGRATFTIAGETLDAPAGTVVALRDPALRRAAVAAEDATVVLAVGAAVGEAFRPSAWEWTFGAEAFRPALDADGALTLLAEGLERHPGNGSIIFQTACWQALAGRTEEALATLGEAVALDPHTATWAQTDADLTAIRGLPGFPAGS
ncbi:MAG: hypothetical protein EXQ77_01450 [Thermoleophilia bacterium]|nr:hypothetical protein [Thermoleophilia bacterium]